jgi:hypothetical protein
MIEIEIVLTFVYCLECTVVQCKDALSIYWNRQGHECSRTWKLSANFTLIQCIKIVSRFFGRDISGTTFFRAESSLIQYNSRDLAATILYACLLLLSINASLFPEYCSIENYIHVVRSATFHLQLKNFPEMYN